MPVIVNAAEVLTTLAPRTEYGNVPEVIFVAFDEYDVPFA
jgi:hypothetical protein